MRTGWRCLVSDRCAECSLKMRRDRARLRVSAATRVRVRTPFRAAEYACPLGAYSITAIGACPSRRRMAHAAHPTTIPHPDQRKVRRYVTLREETCRAAMRRMVCGWPADGLVAVSSWVGQGVTSKLSIVHAPCAFTNVSVVGRVSGTPPELVPSSAVTLAVASLIV